MEFGKVAHIENLDFLMPPDTPFTERILERLRHEKINALPEIYVGCPVWANKDWIGTLYPTGTTSKNYLKCYTQQFSTVEVNSTHYVMPDEPTLLRWKAAATPHFKYCLKWFQGITHEKMLKDCYELTQRFIAPLHLLGNNLGATFLQLPPHFKPTQVSDLEYFIRTLPPDFLSQYPFFVEFRHEDWFKPLDAAQEGWALLASYNIGAVITDVAGRRDAMHMNLTNNGVMIRFKGHGMHKKDLQRMQDWAERLTVWTESGVQKVYFLVHENHNTLAPELSDYLIQALNKRLKLNLKRPQLQVRATQGELF